MLKKYMITDYDNVLGVCEEAEAVREDFLGMKVRMTESLLMNNMYLAIPYFTNTI